MRPGRRRVRSDRKGGGVVPGEDPETTGDTGLGPWRSRGRSDLQTVRHGTKYRGQAGRAERGSEEDGETPRRSQKS